MIKKCDVTLKSRADDAVNSFFAVGNLEEIDRKIKLSYYEDSNFISLTFHDGKAWLDREGDYLLSLALIKGETTRGEIAINGNVGDLEIYTHTVEYKSSKNKLTACLRYDILLGDGAQSMELHVQANVK